MHITRLNIGVIQRGPTETHRSEQGGYIDVDFATGISTYGVKLQKIIADIDDNKDTVQLIVANFYGRAGIKLLNILLSMFGIDNTVARGNNAAAVIEDVNNSNSPGIVLTDEVTSEFSMLRNVSYVRFLDVPNYRYFYLCCKTSWV